MEFISANPDLFDLAHAWAQAHPAASYVFGVAALAGLCYKGYNA